MQWCVKTHPTKNRLLTAGNFVLLQDLDRVQDDSGFGVVGDFGDEFHREVSFDVDAGDGFYLGDGLGASFAADFDVCEDNFAVDLNIESRRAFAKLCEVELEVVRCRAVLFASKWQRHFAQTAGP